MSDLNSASKIERSVSGRRRARVETASATKSDKKRQISQAGVEIMQLEKEIKREKAKYRHISIRKNQEEEYSKEALRISEMIIAKQERL